MDKHAHILMITIILTGNESVEKQKTSGLSVMLNLTDKTQIYALEFIILC